MKLNLALTAALVSLAVAAPAFAQNQAAAPAGVISLEERLGCGQLFMGAGELTKRFPSFLDNIKRGDRTGAAETMRIAALAGAKIYNDAATEAMAAGRTVSDVNQIGLRYIFDAYGDTSKLDKKAMNKLSNELFGRCVTVAQS